MLESLINHDKIHTHFEPEIRRTCLQLACYLQVARREDVVQWVTEGSSRGKTTHGQTHKGSWTFWQLYYYYYWSFVFDDFYLSAK